MLLCELVLLYELNVLCFFSTLIAIILVLFVFSALLLNLILKY